MAGRTFAGVEWRLRRSVSGETLTARRPFAERRPTRRDDGSRASALAFVKWPPVWDDLLW